MITLKWAKHTLYTSKQFVLLSIDCVNCLNKQNWWIGVKKYNRGKCSKSDDLLILSGDVFVLIVAGIRPNNAGILSLRIHHARFSHLTVLQRIATTTGNAQ